MRNYLLSTHRSTISTTGELGLKFNDPGPRGGIGPAGHRPASASRSTMSIIESLLALGLLIEEAIRSVASAANGGRVACADRSLRLTVALRER